MRAFIAEIVIQRPGIVGSVTAAIHEEMKCRDFAPWSSNAYLLSHYATRAGRLVFVRSTITSDPVPQDGDEHLFILQILLPNPAVIDDALAIINRAVQQRLDIPALDFRVRITADLSLERQDV